MKYIFTLFFLSFSLLITQAQPTDNPPAPPARDSVDVIGVYGDAYKAIDQISYDPNWGQSGHMMVNPAFDPGTGENVMAYINFNYQGTDFSGNPQNASLMEFLHVDIWVDSSVDRMVKVSPIDNSGNGPGEVLVEVPLIPGSWNSVDLPKSAFTDMSWGSIFQMKFDGQFNSDGSQNAEPYDVYLDNVYFWKEPTTGGSDATLSDLQVDGSTISGFAAGIVDYSFGLPGGSSNIPQISATTTDPNASFLVSQATAIPGDGTVEVTSADGTMMQIYTVSFFYDSPSDGASSPTALEENVISLFSDAYTDVPVDFWNTSWSNASFEDVMINGNPTKKYTSLGFNGIETTSSPIDASGMDHFNLDIWSPNMTEIKIKLVDFLGDGFGGANGDTEAELTYAVTQGEWTTISIPLSDFTAGGMTSLSDVNQYILTSTPFGSGILYVDNVYFSKMPTSSDDVLADQEVLVYPNPIASGQILQTSKNVSSIEIWNNNGQLVKKANSNTVRLNGFIPGSYIVKSRTKDGKIKHTTLVVQ